MPTETNPADINDVAKAISASISPTAIATTLAEARLPRRLAFKLLHAAQTADNRPFNAVVTRPAAERPPKDMHELAEGQSWPEDDGDTVWAFYLFRPGAEVALSPDDFDVAPEVLRITAFLAAKGVVQLHAWRCVDGRVEEVALRVAD